MTGTHNESEQNEMLFKHNLSKKCEKQGQRTTLNRVKCSSSVCDKKCDKTWTQNKSDVRAMTFSIITAEKCDEKRTENKSSDLSKLTFKYNHREM